MSFSQPNLAVLMMPDYRRGNPYQQLLSDALSAEGVEVQFPTGYRRVFPLYRALASLPTSNVVLHVHWLDQYIKGESLLWKGLYCLKFLLDILLVKASGHRIVWTVHNIVPHNSRYPRLERWVRQQFVKLSDHVILHSQAALRAAKTAYKTELAHASVIPHGHYRSVYPATIDAEKARQILHLNDQGNVYLNFGMLRPYKGIENLLKAWQQKIDNQISESGAATDTLIIVGKASEPNYGQALVQQASKVPQVILRNEFVDNDQLALYYSAADAVVLPFNQLLTSGSLLLAMSYGVPVIAPRLGSIPETLGEAAYLLYDPANSQGLLQALERSKQVPLTSLRQKTIAACSLLSWKKISQATKQLYVSKPVQISRERPSASSA